MIDDWTVEKEELYGMKKMRPCQAKILSIDPHLSINYYPANGADSDGT